MKALVIGATFEGCCYAHYLRECGYHVDIVDNSYYADSVNFTKEEYNQELESFIRSSSFYSENRATRSSYELEDVLFDYDVECCETPNESSRYNRMYAYIGSEDKSVKRIFEAFPNKQISGDIVLPNTNLRKKFIESTNTKNNNYDYELSTLQEMYRADYIGLYRSMLQSFDIQLLDVDCVSNDAKVFFKNGLTSSEYDSIIMCTSARTTNNLVSFSKFICTPSSWKNLIFPHDVMTKEFYNKCFLSDTIFFLYKNSNIIKIFSNGDFWTIIYNEYKTQDEFDRFYDDLKTIISSEDYIDMALGNSELNKNENYAYISGLYRHKLFNKKKPAVFQCNPIENSDGLEFGSVYRTPYSNGIRQTISDTLKTAREFCYQL